MIDDRDVPRALDRAVTGEGRVPVTTPPHRLTHSPTHPLTDSQLHPDLCSHRVGDVAVVVRLVVELRLSRRVRRLALRPGDPRVSSTSLTQSLPRSFFVMRPTASSS